MSEVIEVRNDSDFNDSFNQIGKTVVFFGAESWCVPCRRFRPIFEGVAEKMKDQVAFMHVDIDEAEPSLVKAFNIMSVPTVLLFDGPGDPRVIKARTAIPLVNEINQN